MRDLGILPGHQVKLRKRRLGFRNFPGKTPAENLPRLDEFEAGVPVVQINQRKALGDLGDWEDVDDYPAVPVRMSTSMTLLKGCLACHWENILTVCLGTAMIRTEHF